MLDRNLGGYCVDARRDRLDSATDVSIARSVMSDVVEERVGKFRSSIIAGSAIYRAQLRVQDTGAHSGGSFNRHRKVH